MEKLTLLSLLLILMFSSVHGCKRTWENTCSSNYDCCSKNCDTNNGEWAIGICKPEIKTDQENKNKKTCKWDWDNTCKSQEDCCSGFCDNNDGKWRYGICKPKPEEVTTPANNSTEECRPDWNDSCQVDNDCCSNICHKRSGGWMYGICKPKSTTTIEITTLTTTTTTFVFDETNCKPDWYDRCTNNVECCSKHCFGNNGLWPVGICKPMPTSTTISTTSTTTTATTKFSTASILATTEITTSTVNTETDVTKELTTSTLTTVSVTVISTTMSTTTEIRRTTKEKTVESCNPDWYDKCTRNEQCCSKNCYDNNGKWPTGICKPGEPPIEVHEETEEEAKISFKDERCNTIFTDRMIDLHNEYRKWHSAQRLNLNDKLSSIAKSYTEMLSKQDVGLFHSRNRNWGENLAQVKGGDCKEMAESVFKTWYNEYKLFDFKMDEYRVKTEHFTQIVWKSSDRIGCGVSCIENKCFVACNYLPSGNMGGLYRTNVFKSNKSL